MHKWYFKLLAGTHIGDDMSQPRHPQTGRYPERSYKQGEIFESRIDLAALHGENKFARLTPEQAILSAPGDADPQEDIRRLEQALIEAKARLAGEPAKTSAALREQLDYPSLQPNSPDIVATLEAMTVKELQQHAAAEEIDLRGAKSKEDILRVLRGAVSSV